MSDLAERSPIADATDEEIDAVVAEFGGDYRDAIRALLHDLTQLALDSEAAVSKGFVRGRLMPFHLGEPSCNRMDHQFTKWESRMGQAKLKAKALRDWQEGLSAEEKVVADVAQRVFDRFVVPNRAMGMCYRLAFFLAELLADRHGMTSVPVVGYVNDGTVDFMVSHAWLEVGGKRIDLSLAFTEHPKEQLQGEVLILDRVVRAGTRYAYHREQTPEAIEALNEFRSDPQAAAALAHKETEHAAMLEISGDPARRRAYLDAAPDGYNYARLVEIVVAGN